MPLERVGGLAAMVLAAMAVLLALSASPAAADGSSQSGPVSVTVPPVTFSAGHHTAPPSSTPRPSQPGSGGLPSQGSMPVCSTTVPTSSGTTKADQTLYLPGDTASLTAAGFLAGDEVRVMWSPGAVVVATLTTDASGAVRTAFKVPGDAAVGSHAVQFAGVCGGAATADVLVGRAGSAAFGLHVLPSSWWWLIALLLIALLTAGYLQVARRARRRAPLEGVA